MNLSKNKKILIVTATLLLLGSALYSHFAGLYPGESLHKAVIGASALLIWPAVTLVRIINWRKKITFATTKLSPLLYSIVLLISFILLFLIISFVLYLNGFRDLIGIAALSNFIEIPLLILIAVIEFRRNRLDNVEFPGFSFVLLPMSLNGWFIIASSFFAS